MNPSDGASLPLVTGWPAERRLLLLLACVQFTHLMDFMIMMPLGPQLMRELAIDPRAFGNLISVFALSAGGVGLLAAPFIDRFDRRRVLLFCYAGFAAGTLGCALSHTESMLMTARAVCGAFGGVSGATIMTIAADIVPPERRGRAMGMIMTSFAAASALGVPFGLKLAQWFQWEAPFFAVALLAVIVWLLLWRVLPPVRGHLRMETPPGVASFLALLREGNAWRGLALMMVIVFGHFMVVPYLATYLVKNAGLPEGKLFLVYLTGGLGTIVSGPLIGRLADSYGRFRIYAVVCLVACVVMAALTHAEGLPVWQVLGLSLLFFVFAGGRFVPSQATISLAVAPARRGAYMSLVSCTRDLSSGVTAWIGGGIVVESANGRLEHYDVLGWLAIGVSLLSLWVFRQVRQADHGTGS